MIDDLEKLRELTKTLTSNGYLTDQTKAWQYAFDSVSDLVCITNSSFKIKFINKKFCVKLNINSSNYINESLDVLIDSSLFTLDKHIGVFDESYVCYGEIYIDNLEGWFERYRYYIEDNNGNLIGYTFILRDITERKKAEIKIKESEAKFAIAFKTSPYAITITRAVDGKIIDVNDTFTLLTGYTKEEAEASTSLNLKLWANDSDRNQVIKDLQQGIPVVKQEFSFRKKNNDLIIGLFSANLIVLNSELLILSSISDITERKKIEFELNLNKRLLEGVLDAIPDIITVQDVEHNLIRGNKAAQEHVKLTSSKLEDVKCYQLLGRDDPCTNCPTKDCKISKKPERIERLITELNGWYDCRSYPLLDEDGNVVNIIEHLRDISDFKEEQHAKDIYYKRMLQSYKRLHFLVSAVDGYLWEKTKCDSGINGEMVNTFVDPAFCKDFYGLALSEEDNFKVCKMAFNMKTSELIKSFREDGGRKHTFGDLCVSTDAHCEQQGVPCEYFEMGYIEHEKGNPKWFVLRVRKTPVYNDMEECTGILGFANDCSKDANGIRMLIERGLVTGQVKKLETGSDNAKVYWIISRKKEEKNLTHIDFP